jgi:hypothetical protein
MSIKHTALALLAAGLTMSATQAQGPAIPGIVGGFAAAGGNIFAPPPGVAQARFVRITGADTAGRSINYTLELTGRGNFVFYYRPDTNTSNQFLSRANTYNFQLLNSSRNPVTGTGTSGTISLANSTPYNPEAINSLDFNDNNGRYVQSRNIPGMSAFFTQSGPIFEAPGIFGTVLRKNGSGVEAPFGTRVNLLDDKFNQINSVETNQNGFYTFVYAPNRDGNNNVTDKNDLRFLKSGKKYYIEVIDGGKKYLKGVTYNRVTAQNADYGNTTAADANGNQVVLTIGGPVGNPSVTDFQGEIPTSGYPIYEFGQPGVAAPLSASFYMATPGERNAVTTGGFGINDPRGIQFYCPFESSATQVIFRYYNINTGAHFWKSPAEVAPSSAAGWVLEGGALTVLPYSNAPVNGATTLYRLRNTVTGFYKLEISAERIKAAVANNWVVEVELGLVYL